MEITKYGHACFTVKKNDKILVVDPGGFSTDFVSPDNVVAVVITHDHYDHFDRDQLAGIIDKNPSALIIGPQEVVETIEVFETRAVSAGDSVVVDGFDLSFYGEKHAVVHASMNQGETDNLGVMINDLIYYPGDSFTIPDSEVTILALPTSGPWLKTGEMIDFLQAVAPRRAFPVHEMIHSSQGQTMTNQMLAKAAEKTQTDYIVLEPGQSMTV